MLKLGFEPPALSDAHLASFDALLSRCGTDIVTMTALANSGHPGGSFSTLPALLMLYANANVAPGKARDPGRDRIIVSHGHVSPATYSTLAAFGFCDRDQALTEFRRFGSHFSGHVEMSVPGVEWNTGNLGQGLSVGVGAALAARLDGADPSVDLRGQEGASFKVAVVMGDGEQQKGQISEARRLAVKYGCSNLVAIIDYNRVQICGDTEGVMPQDIPAGWRADGWNVLDCDGHDWQELYGALRAAWRGEAGDPSRPTVIMAHTTMGKPVDFMMDGSAYHGKPPSISQARDAIAQLGGVDRLDELEAMRAALPPGELGHHFPELPPPALDLGEPIVYGSEGKYDCRGAYGAAMQDLAARNNGQQVQIAAFGADLTPSVKLAAFQKQSPGAFLEGGIAEHNTATVAGRLSREGLSTFYSTFGIFGVTEGFNQQRLNGFNRANLKLCCTHCGTDVGEDGPTHQVVDYVGLLRSTFDWEVFFPADANQCDRTVRTVASRPGNQFVGMGRSKMPVLTHPGGSPYYDGSVGFEPGRADVIREGDDGAILAFGPMVYQAQVAHDLIAAQSGKRVRVVNMASLRPFDRQAILDAAATGYLLTAEDHNPDTGLGGLVALALADAGVACRLERAGVDCWPMSGTPTDLFAAYRLDAKGLTGRVLAALNA